MYLENYRQVNKDIRKLRRRFYPYIGVAKNCTSFLFAIKFTIVTDHRSLCYIFDSHSSLSKGRHIEYVAAMGTAAKHL